MRTGKKRRAFVPLSAVLLLGSAPGCVAIQGGIERLTSLERRVAKIEDHLSQTDKVLAGLSQLRPERRLVLDLKGGASFAPNSAVLPEGAKRQIDRFLSDLSEPRDKLLLVAGHTDNTGSAAANRTLGQKRADSVAHYLITYKGIDPLRVATVSYGASAPVAANTTEAGRSKNRRVELLVYEEALNASP